MSKIFEVAEISQVSNDLLVLNHGYLIMSNVYEISNYLGCLSCLKYLGPLRCLKSLRVYVTSEVSNMSGALTI